MTNKVWPIDANAGLDAFYEADAITMKGVAIINQFPTVDAKPVKHSKWVCVNENDNVWMCDGIEGCGGEMIILEKTPLENGFHFCPYCGADMRERS